ncbi:MAG TPA: 1-acyl-sn-glycerol-3-phosphate acyltransferase [Planctomycetes bacterium]|nr:1-acyl-sn-glycerol-3-phosphate acyltransferase [Planctomycetota bacterium]
MVGMARQVFRVLFGFRVVNPPTLRPPYVLAPNHVSFLDPVVVQLAHPRHVTFLMTEAIYRVRPLRWFFRFWEAIPVPEDRAPGEALKAAFRTIRSGGVVGIYPEGQISPNGTLQEGKQGVAMIMLRAGVPVVPVAIFGTYEVLPRQARFPRPGRIRVVFGDPIFPPETPKDRKGAARELSARVMEAIAALQARHGDPQRA